MDRRAALWGSRALLAVALVWVAWQSLVPGDEVVVATPFDKVNHLAAYAALGLLAGLSLGRYSRAGLVWAWLGVVVFGLLLEVGQAFTPYRSAEFADLVADAIGAAVGVLVAAAVIRVLRRP